MQEARSLRRFLCKAIALAMLGLGWYAPAVLAKQSSLIVIELYDGPSGPAYVQLADVLINGKPELRDCTPFQNAAIDKSTYGKLGKLVPGPGGVLERDNDGALRYRVGAGQASCAAPDQVKYDHNAAYSLSELADRATLTGTSVSSSSGAPAAPAPLKKGVKLVFIGAPNPELAEFLLAQRASDVAGWLNYLSKYPAAAHISDAKLALALLYVEAGEASVSTYEKSASTGSPTYGDLKDAKVQADKARTVYPDLAQTAKLLGELRGKLTAITEKGRSELEAYQIALRSHQAGYVHLQTAKKLSDAVNGIDPTFPTGLSFLADVTQAGNAFDKALRTAESSVVAKQMDQALESVAPLHAFASEEPRIQAVIDAAYDYYLQLGKQFAATGDWDSAVKQFDKAAKTKATSEAQDSLKEGHRQLTIAQDKAAAAKALESSKEYEDQKDAINAFDVLYNLPPPQQALVADDIARLKDGYIQSAVRAVKDLQKAHLPIRGLGDEIGIEKAYAYLERVYELSKEDSYSDTMGILGDDLSAYFVDQAKRYLDKPSGSGTELGWTYLEEALFYKPSNQAAHDAKVAATPAHAMHSKLSMRVQFRDQTSLRESTGFIRQLEDATITGLEASKLQVKAVRFGETTGGVEPDFQLDGNVLEHQITETPSVDSRESKYLAGTHDIPSDTWNKANRDYEAALRQLQTDQSALQGAEAKGNKHDMHEFTAKVSADQQQASDAQALADSTPKTVTTDVTRSYQYTRRTIDIRNIIKLQFRIGDTLSGQMGDPIVVEKEDPRQFVLLQDVKPEDTEGVKMTGTTPNTIELQTALENAARDELNEKVLLKVQELPRKIYDSAKSKELEENMEGAGEYYLRYLSCTPEDGSAERRHAKEFLDEKFNIRPVVGVSP
jgi:tetratricopeptide (TPR) repeat protein